MEKGPISADSLIRALGSTTADRVYGHRRASNSCGRLGGFLVGELAHDFDLGDNDAIHGCLTVHLGDRRFAPADLHLHAELVAGTDGPAEFGLLNRRKQDQFVIAILNLVQHEYSGHLSHRLDDQNARHYRVIRKMPGAPRLVRAYVFDSDDAFRFEFDNRVDQEHRIAMRQDLPYRISVQKWWHAVSLLYQAMDRFLRYALSKQKDIIALIRELVECESPSDDPAAVNRFVDLFASQVADIAKVRTLAGGNFGRHLRCEFELPGARKKGRILALGHSDTVWPVGTLRSMPFRHKGGRLWGPGVFDMKAGLAFFVFAMRALRELDVPAARRVLLQINADEEVGSESSRAYTEDAARKSDFVLVLEPSAGLDGKLKTARKGVGDYAVTVHGKGSHAGLDFMAGASAIVELARQIERIAGFTKLERGITVNPGVIRGGTRTNVVAEEASVEVDVRIARMKDQGYIEKQFRSLKPFDQRCSIEVSGGIESATAGAIERDCGVVQTRADTRP